MTRVGGIAHEFDGLALLLEQIMEADDQDHWKVEWHTRLEMAKKYPALFTGSETGGHRNAVNGPLRLVWEAKAFRDPRKTTLHLSPTQYIVQCNTGPLLHPIQKMYKFGRKRMLWDEWHEVDNKLHDEMWGRLVENRPRLRGWRRSFTSCCGVRLWHPMTPVGLAHRFAIAYNTDEGFWCQSFEEGWPTGDPFLIAKTSPTGLFVAGALNPEWFTGLPFTAEDTEIWSAQPYLSIEWHPVDDLVGSECLRPEGLNQWL
jgi:hypothetical protein